MGGFYQLVIYLKKDKTIKIGKLCKKLFPAGYYIYTGSAKNNLEKRIARHCRKEKKLKWHIDYLLQYASIKKVNRISLDGNSECELNGSIKQSNSGQILVKGFGSSDCRCISHLVYFSDKNKIPLRTVV